MPVIKRNPEPGKKTITHAKYLELLEAFRIHGDNFKAVKDACGVHWNTAKRAWLRGWSDQKSKPWALPIQQVIKDEQVQARAALQREKEATLGDHRVARQDALRDAVAKGFDDLVDSRSKQGKVIRAARENSIASLIVSQKLLKAAIPLSDKIVEELNENNSLTVFERMRLMRQLGRFASDAIETAQVVEEMERKALGEPDVLLEVQHGVNMTPSEALETLHEMGEVLKAYDEGAEIEGDIDVESNEYSTEEE